MNVEALSCSECRSGKGLDFDFAIAFQPIVSLQSASSYAYEALVRGALGEPSSTVFRHVNSENLYAFDQACRVRAIAAASEMGITTPVSINFLPRAVYRPELCIRTTLKATEEFGIPVEQLIFEVSEREELDDIAHLRHIFEHYRDVGFRTAIDDFGAGHSGLRLLAELEPDIVKIDSNLVAQIASSPRHRTIVSSVAGLCESLGAIVVAEGVETLEQMRALEDLGIDLQQGFRFGEASLSPPIPIPLSVFRPV